MTRHEYTLVDVFTDRMFGGNQLAVFTDGRGIPSETMQAVATELMIAETTFVLPREKDGDHKVRIFTPGKELPFAGHPTVGTTWVLSGGRDGALKLELGVGTYLVRHGIARTGETIIAEQGFEIGRPSLLHIRIDGTRERISGVHVGGNVVNVGGGWMDL